MAQTRRTVIAIIAAGLASAAAIVVFGVEGGVEDVLSRLPGRPAVEVTVASSVTKQKWLSAAAEEFAAAGVETSSGRPIRIVLSQVLSGESMLGIAEGRLQPVVWSPGEANWVDQLNERWERGHDRPIASSTCAPTVRTPVGFAMWRPMAEALGWPGKPIGWSTIIDLANDPEGWARYGHPEWGRFRLGHTHPQYSSAGLLFLASVIYAVTGKTNGITAADIYSPKVEAALSTLAQNTAKYGMITTDLLTNMADQGPAFLHLSAAFEEGTVRMNAERPDALRWPLAFIFPREGTFWSDHPYCILDQSGWVDPDQAEAARLFLDHLLSPAAQADAGRHLIRPLDGTTPLGSLLTTSAGTDPSATPETVPAFAIPTPDVSEAIIDQFLTTKRKASVFLVLDVSGSMQGEAIQTATEATARFLDRLHPADEVGLITFSDDVRVVSTLRPVAEVSEGLRSRVLSLVAAGGTNLHGAVCEAAGLVRRAKDEDRLTGENRLYGIVVLSDGEDSTGAISATKMFSVCLAASEGSEPPRIHTIAFGSSTDLELLQRLADETRGGHYTADAASIEAAYLKISAEQ